jgi:predicted SprT family Zn-dependent metalloprotease
MTMQGAIPVDEESRLEPICPHCETTLRTVATRRLTGMLGKRYVYYCGHCAKVLGVTHRKGFWMG